MIMCRPCPIYLTIESEWIASVNAAVNIESFVDEQSIIDHQWDTGIELLNWMKIFNSKVELSDCFIVKFIDLIDWTQLIRPIAESILGRYASRVVLWNAQLYGRIRTYEFMVEFQNKFNWAAVSRHPPTWFSDIHFDQFGDRMNWRALTSRYQGLGDHIIRKFVDRVDWEWISEHNIRGEAFAINSLYYINWDHPRLDTSNLSTEFLFDVSELRRVAYMMKVSPLAPIRNPKNRLMAFLDDGLAQGFNPNAPLRIGATITLRFAFDHYSELNWIELYRKNMVTDEMLAAIDARD